MLTIVFVVTTLASAVVAIRFYILAASQRKDISQLNADNNQLQNNLSVSQQQTESYRTEVDSIRSEIAEHQKTVALAKQEQQHLNEEMTKLQQLSEEKLLQQAQQHKERLAEREETVKKHEEALKQEAAKREADLKKHFEELQAKTKDTFESLANQSLKKSSEQFLQLAQKSFEGEHKEANAELEKRKVAIENIVKPIKENLEKYNNSMNELEKSRKESYGELNATIKGMVQDQKNLRHETAKLVSALKRPEVRGRWGEMQLRRVAEMAGMIAHCDFEEQVTVNSGTQRPDMIVRLPANREIVVDAKTPIDAYISALESDNDNQRIEFLHKHTQNIQKQVNDLASKRYIDQFDRTPDFTILFIPGESFLQPAVQEKPTLLEEAINKGIIIATPSTLIALLKAIAMGWREEAIAENARKISDVGQELHKRIVTCTGHLERLGKSISNTVSHFNKFVGSFESQVMVQARRFEELEAASPKPLPTEGESGYSQIESQPRQVKVIESKETSPENNANQQMNILDS